MIENEYKKIMIRQKNINKRNLIKKKLYIKRGLHKTWKKKKIFSKKERNKIKLIWKEVRKITEKIKISNNKK